MELACTDVGCEMSAASLEVAAVGVGGLETSAGCPMLVWCGECGWCVWCRVSGSVAVSASSVSVDSAVVNSVSGCWVEVSVGV